MLRVNSGRWSRTYWLVAVALFLVWLSVYVVTVSPGVNFIDSGELITASYESGIAHPPGYPLYVLMGYVASHLLPGQVAWRVNLLSAFWGAAAVAALFLFLVELSTYLLTLTPNRTSRAPTAGPKRRRRAQSQGPQPAKSEAEGTDQPGGFLGVSGQAWLMIGVSAFGASLLGASATFWSRTAQAKMYTLHYFFIAALFFLVLRARRAMDRRDDRATRRWLLTSCLLLGLSFTNHLMTSLLVLPLLVLLLSGAGWAVRLKSAARHWAFMLPALLLPLLLYLYLPIRSAQDPLMNWGTPDNWGDFWRHVGGWQYRTYLFQDIGTNLDRVRIYLFEQWSWLSVPIVLLALAGGVLLARSSLPVFLSTLLFGVLTYAFGLAYGISEIEPYIVPLYMTLVIWLAAGPASLASALAGVTSRTGSPIAAKRPAAQRPTPALPVWGIVVLALLAVGSAGLEFPLQNRSSDHLAEQFVSNVFSELPANSILITDYWDFYAPTIYLQTIEQMRPDLALVDMSLLRYPWYIPHLQKRYPWLIANSRDIVPQFQDQQRRWVNGEPFDSNRLNELYYGLLTSFVTRNEPTHPAFTLFTPPCDGPTPNPAAGCEIANVASDHIRQRTGLTVRLWKSPPPQGTLPPQPHYATEGITTNKVPLDDFAIANTRLYVNAYRALADVFSRSGNQQAAQNMLASAAAIDAALRSR